LWAFACGGRLERSPGTASIVTFVFLFFFNVGVHGVAEHALPPDELLESSDLRIRPSSMVL
jgi:hypothetical protein